MLVTKDKSKFLTQCQKFEKWWSTITLIIILRIMICCLNVNFGLKVFFQIRSSRSNEGL